MYFLNFLYLSFIIIYSNYSAKVSKFTSKKKSFSSFSVLVLVRLLLNTIPALEKSRSMGAELQGIVKSCNATLPMVSSFFGSNTLLDLHLLLV